ncbi:MAG: tRNA-dihydrouridine synthase [Candidatus Kaiserbacteria bacterium]|nr:tRNA-dihydrouridine synthase [Candidatus Kaiserbacteria bacterium]
MESFWNKLEKPFFVLAPMEDVTDAAFRKLIAEYGKPDVTWTEFTSADGLVRANEKGMRRLKQKLLYQEGERPIVAQLFSANPDNMEVASRLCAELGFDGIDINMGCPDKTVEKQMCGSGMIKHPERAIEIIRAAKRGAGSVPVSVKTRIGYAGDEIDTWIATLLREDLAALTVHLRTRNEMSDVPAHWDLMPRIVALRNNIAPHTRIIGNGDVQNIADAKNKIEESGCDGAMFGRAIFGNPWLFTGVDKDTISPDEKVKTLIKHISYFQELLTGIVSEAVMKRHFKAYVYGWPGAVELRSKLMETNNLDEAKEILSTVTL